MHGFKISIAPMLDWTDKYYRYFMRQITTKTILYTEMIVADAIIHGNQKQLLGFNPLEEPLVLQLGGSCPKKISQAVLIAKDFGYTKFNLNCGCPSDKVLSGSFGATLMKEPCLVSKIVQEVYKTSNSQLSIKCRTGLDYNYDYVFLTNFIKQLALSGVNEFIIHARNAVMQGLNPKENREIPPLRYDLVSKLKTDYPQLDIQINGGIKTIEEIQQFIPALNGVMIGREAYQNPYLLHDFDNIFFNCNPIYKTRKKIAKDLVPYLELMLTQHERLHKLTRHILGLFYNVPQARYWRHMLSTEVAQKNDLNAYLKLIENLND